MPFSDGQINVRRRPVRTKGTKKTQPGVGAAPCPYLCVSTLGWCPQVGPLHSSFHQYLFFCYRQNQQSQTARPIKTNQSTPNQRVATAPYPCPRTNTSFLLDKVKAAEDGTALSPSSISTFLLLQKKKKKSQTALTLKPIKTNQTEPSQRGGGHSFSFPLHLVPFFFIIQTSARRGWDRSSSLPITFCVYASVSTFFLIQTKCTALSPSLRTSSLFRLQTRVYTRVGAPRTFDIINTYQTFSQALPHPSQSTTELYTSKHQTRYDGTITRIRYNNKKTQIPAVAALNRPTNTKKNTARAKFPTQMSGGGSGGDGKPVPPRAHTHPLFPSFHPL